MLVYYFVPFIVNNRYLLRFIILFRLLSIIVTFSSKFQAVITP